jgi:hypothetical protein
MTLSQYRSLPPELKIAWRFIKADYKVIRGFMRRGGEFRGELLIHADYLRREAALLESIPENATESERALLSLRYRETFGRVPIENAAYPRAL